MDEHILEREPGEHIAEVVNNRDYRCGDCIHVHEDEVTCDAFPNVIPSVFLYGIKRHTKPYPGDHGIQFKKK